MTHSQRGPRWGPKTTPHTQREQTNPIGLDTKTTVKLLEVPQLCSATIDTNYARSTQPKTPSNESDRNQIDEENSELGLAIPPLHPSQPNHDNPPDLNDLLPLTTKVEPPMMEEGDKTITQSSQRHQTAHEDEER